MYICLCEPVTEREIQAAVDTGCRSVREVASRLGCCRDCGKCARAAKEVIDAARADRHVIHMTAVA
jgi:bacterioferritin-associated ferredoxin